MRVRNQRPEAAILKACLDLLSLRGVLAWRNNTGAIRIGGRLIRFGHVGSPDILGVAPDGSGRILAIEVKAPGRRPTPAQRAFLAAVQQFGGLAWVISDVRELAAALDGLAGSPGHIWGRVLDAEGTDVLRGVEGVAGLLGRPEPSQPKSAGGAPSEPGGPGRSILESQIAPSRGSGRTGQ